MRRLRAWVVRLFSLWRRSRQDRELAAELAAHIEMHIDDNLRLGMSSADARRLALIKLGGLDQTTERYREQQGLPLVETTMQDLRYAVRSLRKSPVFAITAIVTLALGIGANTAIFSIVDGVLLRPSPFAALTRLVAVWETDRTSGTTREPASSPDYYDFERQATQFGILTAVVPAELNLTSASSDPRRIAALWIGHDFFQMVGMAPLIGRPFVPAEHERGREQVAIISEDLWEGMFARDPAVLSRSIRVDDIDRTVIAVMPRGADFGTLQLLQAAEYSRGFAERGDRTRVDVWIPLRPDPALRREQHGMFMLGGLAGAATTATAQQEMSAMAAELERKYPVNTGRGIYVEPLADVVFGPVRPALTLLLAAVALVFLVAAANVANLLLVRASERVREVTLRAALGAGTGRLARQFFVEGAVLALAGALLGVALSFGGVSTLKALAPSSLPRVDFVHVDARVLSITFAMSVAVALLFGALPMLHLRRHDLQAGLKGSVNGTTAGGRSQARLRSTIVVGELAIAAMLVVGAGLLIKSLWNLQQVDPGFTSAGVLKAEFQLPLRRYPQDFSTFPNWPARGRFFQELRYRLTRIPGVRDVAVAAANPLDAGFTSSIRVVGREAEGASWPEPSIRTVSDSYFRTMRLQVVSGRAFDASDDGGSAPVVMINEAANRRFFDNRVALGQLVRLWAGQRRIVGVTADEHVRGLAEAAPPAVYLPLAQAPMASALLVRTDGNPSLLAPDVRRVVRDIDPLLPLFGIEPLTETLGHSQAQRRFTMIVLASFASIALLLAAVGVHAVLSYAVAQRTREIGIRVALGADLPSVRALVLSQAGWFAAAGIAVGLSAAIGLTRFLQSLLFGVGARDPWLFGSAAALLTLVALTASWLPARRAMRIDPIHALRQD